MRNVTLCNYKNHTIYCVSIFTETGLINLFSSNQGRTFNNINEMQNFVLNLLAANDLTVKYTKIFSSKLYDIIWCNLQNPEYHEQFFYNTKNPGIMTAGG